MRVHDARLTLRRAELEPPDVIAEVGAAENARLREVHEVAVDGRAVHSETQRSERGDGFGVAHGAHRRRQPAKNGDARSGAAKARPPQLRAKLVDRPRLRVGPFAAFQREHYVARLRPMVNEQAGEVSPEKKCPWRPPRTSWGRTERK